MFFNNMFSSTPQPNPADVYAPDLTAAPAGFPNSYDDLHAGAITGVLAALDAAEETSCYEVDFPPIASINARGDGSAKSEELIAGANAEFVSKLLKALKKKDRRTQVVGCGARTTRALGASAVSLRDAKTDVAKSRCDVAIVVAPADVEQWEAATQLNAETVVIVNGLLNNGFAAHAYYYKPLSAFSAQTGGCVRRYPGPYAIYDVSGQKLDDIEVPLLRQGRRALPDTKNAQMALQNRFGSGSAAGSGRAGGSPRMMATSPSSSSSADDVIALSTRATLPARVTPQALHDFLATPSNWPKIVLSSQSVTSSTADVNAPLGVGMEVDEIFGLPPLLPLSVRWTCVRADRDGGRLEFSSPAGLRGVASNCKMAFCITASSTGTDLLLEMEYEPMSPLARLAVPVLSIDNALAIKLLLPRAVD